MNENLLLLSNSTNPGENFLEWPKDYICNFLRNFTVRRLLFIPYAKVNLSEDRVHDSFDEYEKRVAAVFAELGFELESIHRKKDPPRAVKKAKAIIVGGGNTFHLVKMMHKTGIMKAIRNCIFEGARHMNGWACMKMPWETIHVRSA